MENRKWKLEGKCRRMALHPYEATVNVLTMKTANLVNLIRAPSAIKTRSSHNITHRNTESLSPKYSPLPKRLLATSQKFPELR